VEQVQVQFILGVALYGLDVIAPTRNQSIHLQADESRPSRAISISVIDFRNSDAALTALENYGATAAETFKARVAR
jgi:hypothetical protein